MRRKRELSKEYFCTWKAIFAIYFMKSNPFSKHLYITPLFNFFSFKWS